MHITLKWNHLGSRWTPGRRFRVNRQGARLTLNRENNERRSGSLIYRFDKLLVCHRNEYMIGSHHHRFAVSIERYSKGMFYFR